MNDDEAPRPAPAASPKASFDVTPILAAVQQLTHSEQIRASHEATVQHAEIEADKEVRLESLKSVNLRIEKDAEAVKQRATFAWGVLGFVTIVVILAFVFALVTGDKQVLVSLGIAGISAAGGYGAGLRKGTESERARRALAKARDEDDEDD